jgi:phospholipid/cholesterol/gamma-HCH transport system substrate-binding protein
MVKETPSLGRIMAMVAFAMSCFGILLFLWLAFGGSVPLRPQAYRFTASFPEAATLAQEADVRMAGVNVGKVKTKELDKRGARTKVEIEIKPQYAPIPADTKAILRQKTLLGETYVELSTGSRNAKKLADGGHLNNQQVEPTVELDEIFNSFDKPTRHAFQEWVAELNKSIKGGRGEDLNDAFGNLEGFSTDGATLFKTLDEQQIAVRRLVKNTGVVFGAINEREGALRQLIVNSNNTFEATASRDRALADTFRVFPTFLDESKATMARLEKFSNNTRPLVNALKPSADDLGPTVRDLGDLAPNLEALFRDLPPLINASKTGVPDLTRVLKGAEPVLEATHVFFPQLNPILSEFNFYQSTLAGFITNGSADLAGDFGGQRYQTQVGIIEPERSFLGFPARTRPATERGQTYLQPNALTRGISLGGFESFDCKPSGGEKHDAVDSGPNKAPPCFVSPPSLYNGKQFIKPGKGQAPLRRAPRGNEGTKPADPDQR